ncbi:MAG: hypothetical protein H0U44_10430 [Flavisolibacter sp.]|nr:hypothetical protein [Flavisolibacter sp.]
MRMHMMVSPLPGKEFFELVSLVVIALNGCALCVIAHERPCCNMQQQTAHP